MIPKVLIVGYGVVGKNLAGELSVLKPDIYDKYKIGVSTKKDQKYDFCFICVDTPATEDSLCDMVEVENAIKENEANVYIIKSTVLPGTTEQLSWKLNKHIVFSPEYYGGTQHCNNFNFDYTIVGGNRRDCTKVVQLLQHVYDGRHIFRMVSAETAELAKYMENCWLATKVVFCNQFAQMSKVVGVDYEELRELFILDPRVNPSHTFVYKDKPYYDSHCLNKDVPALAQYLHNDFLWDIIRTNEMMKPETMDKKD